MVIVVMVIIIIKILITVASICEFHCCHRCCWSTSNQSKMESHLPTPSGDKMQKCSECQKSYSQAGHLKIHMITHRKGRTYACVQCWRSWGGTWSATVGRKYTTVKNAESALAESLCSSSEATHGSKGGASETWPWVALTEQRPASWWGCSCWTS